MNISTLDLLNVRIDLSDVLSWRAAQSPRLIQLFPTRGSERGGGSLCATSTEHSWLEGLDAPKTKQVVKLLGDFGIDAKALFITADEAENVEKSARNIQGVKAINTNGLNVFDILNSDKLFITKDAITRIEEVFA